MCIRDSSAPDAFKKLAPSLHSLPFAALLYTAAQNEGGAELTDFALGYGCHLAQDSIGHHANGFLNPQEDHPLEFAVDAYVSRQHSPEFVQMDTEMTQLVASASATANGSVPVVSPQEAIKAVSEFRALTTAERAAVAVDVGWSRAIVKDSFCAVSELSDALQNFWLSGNWTLSVCAEWQNSMITGESAASAMAKQAAVVEQLFAGNNGTSCYHSR
eukprot:TRINITY_DN32793_c0_g1_i1.p1 TRINITY_DN32793_c0_g1~~TRINITY_DN32793_c0_g1_i1.p1  ORF type:complete len:216 (-),score=52.14 TRINITY_DN32793_c0_g1_i1:199-846(-)